MSIKANKVCTVAKNTLENMCTPLHLVSDHNPLEKIDSAQLTQFQMISGIHWYRNIRGEKKEVSLKMYYLHWKFLNMSYMKICFSLSHIILEMLMVWERSLVLDSIFVLNCDHPSNYALVHIIQGGIKIACGKWECRCLKWV